MVYFVSFMKYLFRLIDDNVLSLILKNCFINKKFDVLYISLNYYVLYSLNVFYLLYNFAKFNRIHKEITYQLWIILIIFCFFIFLSNYRIKALFLM